MPNYTFKNTLNDEIETMFLTIAEREEYLAANPHMTQLLAAPPQGDAIRLGIKKNSSQFRELVQRIKTNNHRSTIQT